MTYTFKFNNLTEEQENKFNGIIKGIPYDVVGTFQIMADLMGLELQVNVDGKFTELVVINK